MNLDRYSQHKVGIVLVFRDATGAPKIPVLHRRCKKGTHDTWTELPGGKRDPVYGGGLESIEETARRELWEELGVEISPDDFRSKYLRAIFADSIVIPKTKHTQCRFVLVECPPGVIPYNREPLEHDRMDLVHPQRAIQLVRKRTTQEVKDYLLALR